MPIAFALPFLVVDFPMRFRSEGAKAAIGFGLPLGALWTIHVVAAMTLAAATLVHVACAPFVRGVHRAPHGRRKRRAFPLRGAVLIERALLIQTRVPQRKALLSEIATPKKCDAYNEAGVRMELQYHVALVDAAGSMLWTTATQRSSIYAVCPTSFRQPEEACAFLRGGASDTRFLVERGVTVVVTLHAVNNPGLVPVTDGMCALRPEITSHVQRTGKT
ncbi:MAG: hypothetical protein WDA16_14860 [Candidatus Thermoplasmatota archaeon]